MSCCKNRYLCVFSYCQLLLFVSIPNFTSHAAFIELQLLTCTWLQCQSIIKNSHVERLYIACKIAMGDITELTVPYIKIVLTNSSSNSGIGRFASVDEPVCFLFVENDSPIIHHVVSLLRLLGNDVLRLGLIIAAFLR